MYDSSFGRVLRHRALRLFDSLVVAETRPMTLNITVTTDRCIYQSADYRLLDLTTGKTSDFETQKIVLLGVGKWSATVCFAGVGRAPKLDVSEWLAERVAMIQFGDPFDRLLEELLQANSWLSTIPEPNNRHSFSVGAFVGSEPVFALVSNFEQLFGPVARVASRSLSVYQHRPTKPKTFVSGQTQTMRRTACRRLAALAAKDPAPEQMYSALAAANRTAARQSKLVSRACYTTHVHRTGQSGGRVHDIGNRPFFPTFAIPKIAKEVITQLLEKQFGPERYQLVAMSGARSDPSDDYHDTQLRDKPNDPNTHSNYGAFLQENKKDMEGAERAYRKALALDANHINALGNLANLMWSKGNRDEAASLYRKALEAGPGQENVTWNYARFLDNVLHERRAARETLDRGIAVNPNSGRLLLLRAELDLLDGNTSEALAGFQQAREKGANQTFVETGYAITLHVSGAPVGECIAAYRTAIAVNPNESGLRLNLAQLLFVKGDDDEAKRLLQEAERLGLDDSAQLEAQFYFLSHTASDPSAILRTAKSLLARGIRLRWNVHPNIETVRRGDPQKADLLELVYQVLTGQRDQASLDQVIARWPRKTAN
jgi:Flp pilus assembly protein TadD